MEGVGDKLKNLFGLGKPKEPAADPAKFKGQGHRLGTAGAVSLGVFNLSGSGVGWQRGFGVGCAHRRAARITERSNMSHVRWLVGAHGGRSVRS